MSLRDVFGSGPLVILGFVIDGEEQLMRLDFSTAEAARECHAYLRARIEGTEAEWEPLERFK